MHSEDSWEKPRQLSDFAGLLKHSPFSLPTAEEHSPLSERYAITGIVSIGGEQQIFVFDRTDQSRELLTTSPNARNMALVSILNEEGSPLKATIRVGQESGTIGLMEAAPQQVDAAAQQQPGVPAAQVMKPPMPGAPRQLPQVSAPGTGTQTPQGQGGRRIIRRPVVLPQPAQPPQRVTP